MDSESHNVDMTKENKNTLKEENQNISSSNDNEANVEASSNTQSYNSNGKVLKEQPNGKDIVSNSNAAGTFSDLNTLILNTPEGEVLNLT